MAVAPLGGVLGTAEVLGPRISCIGFPRISLMLRGFLLGFCWETGGPRRLLASPRNPESKIKPKSNRNQIESNSNQNPDRILIEILGNPRKSIIKE